MRELYLENSKGERYSFQTQSRLLHELSGLGFDISSDYVLIDNFYVQVKEEYSQQKINGTLSFFIDGYKQYSEFIDFINNGDFSLVYKPHDTEFFRNITIESVGKSEKDESGILNCDCNFCSLSPWHKRGFTHFVLTEELENKKYDYKYPYSYSIYSKGIIDVVCQGSLNPGYKINMKAKDTLPLTNPSIELWDVDKKVLISKMVYIGDVPQKSTLVFEAANTTNRFGYIDKQNKFTSLLDEIDIAECDFLNIETGKNYQLIFGCINGFDSLDLLLMEYPKGV